LVCVRSRDFGDCRLGGVFEDPARLPFRSCGSTDHCYRHCDSAQANHFRSQDPGLGKVQKGHPVPKRPHI